MLSCDGVAAGRYRKIFPVLFVSLWMVGCPAVAAPTELSLSEALRQAHDNSPALLAASRLMDISLGERQQAALLPNPELSWEVEDTRSDTRTTTTQITQPIELGGKRGARIALAEKGQTAASVELERSQNELRANVIQSFYDNLQAKMRVELAEQSLMLAERVVQGAEGRVKAGKVSPVELTRAQVQLSEVQLELRRAQRDQANAYARLQSVIGGDSTEISVIGDATKIPEPPALEQLWSALGNTAEMRLARLSVAQQEATFELEKTQRIPDLNVSLGSQYSEEDRERVNVVGLSMPIPLFNRNQGNILSAARRADQARDLRNAAELRLRADVQQTMDQWVVANEEINSFDQTILPSAKSAVDSATRGFEMGKFSFLDVLDAQRTLIGARAQYVDALASATAAWVQLERVYGDVSAIHATR